MLRWLEHGNNIHLVEISLETHPVDVKEDIEVVESILASRSKI
jgi:CMP-2-keto-3-deoxyoctulosonic acid synthetase